MELALTFGAFGDLLALSSLIKNIIVCLDDCRGSSKEYQDLVQSLVLLDSALREVDQIARDPRRVNAARRLCETAQNSVRHIQETLKSFNETLQKYRASLGPSGSGNRIKDVARKIQFKLGEEGVTKFRGEVTGYTVVLKMLMEAMMLQSLEQNHQDVSKTLLHITTETQQTRRNLEVTSRTLTECVTDIGRQVLNKLAFLTQVTTTVQQSASQITSSVLSLSLELSSFRVLLMTLQQGPVDKYYFTIEDALGRVFPIHLNTITSWDAFAFVLGEKFQGLRGARRVRERRYKLIELATRREIDQSRSWGASFLPRQKIVMSLLCKDADSGSESTSQLATCPWCKTVSASDTNTQVQCQSCNMFFTRVVELDDVVLPPQPSTAREAPQFGQPSFNVQLPPELSKERRKRRNIEDQGRHGKKARHDTSRNRKRRYGDEDDDVESDDEDVHGLVRVTLVSKRKRIKVFQVPKTKPNGSPLKYPSTVPVATSHTLGPPELGRGMNLDKGLASSDGDTGKRTQQKDDIAGPTPTIHAQMPYETFVKVAPPPRLPHDTGTYRQLSPLPSDDESLPDASETMFVTEDLANQQVMEPYDYYTKPTDTHPAYYPDRPVAYSGEEPGAVGSPRSPVSNSDNLQESEYESEDDAEDTCDLQLGRLLYTTFASRYLSSALNAGMRTPRYSEPEI